MIKKIVSPSSMIKKILLQSHMIKKILLCLSLMCVSSGLFATPLFVSRENILVTNDGIFINHEGQLMVVESITFHCEGFYQVTAEGYCQQCGWKLKDGRCPNRNCDGRGPPRE